jgi:hypothetical protein
MSTNPWPSPDAVAVRERRSNPACDHDALAGREIQSTHTTSEGTVAYARCSCGAWLVLLDGEPLATPAEPG